MHKPDEDFSSNIICLLIHSFIFCLSLNPCATRFQDLALCFSSEDGSFVLFSFLTRAVEVETGAGLSDTQTGKSKAPLA